MKSNMDRVDTSYRQSDERGLVSFTITIIMMLVISLIVIGFTQVTNSNRREQLDRQLSMQAFYAAESGVNDTVQAISTALAGSGTVAAQTDCSGAYTPKSLSSDGSVAYTCVLVDPRVSEIVTTANQATSKVIPIKMVDSGGTPFPPAGDLYFTFTWSPMTGGSSNPADCDTTGVFERSASYTCGFPVLRVDLMSTRNIPSISAQGLAGNTSTFFLQPVSGGSAPVSLANFSQKGYVVGSSCSGGSNPTCTGTIILSGNAKTSDYYVRLSSLYGDTDRVVIDASNTTGLGGSSAFFIGAQAKIDVTGRAQDVLRRVEVIVPLQIYDTTLIPQGGVQSSADVCKQFSVYDGYFSPPSC